MLPLTPSFFPISLFENEHVYPNPPLYFKNVYLVWFHTFTAGEEFGLRMNHSCSYTQTSVRCDLDEIFNLELILKWVKTSGAAGIE